MIIDKSRLALHLAGDDQKEAEKLSKYCSNYDGLKINALNYEQITSFITIVCDCDKPYKRNSIRYMDLIKKQLHGNDFVSGCGCRYIVELTRYEREILCSNRRLKNSEITEQEKNIKLSDVIHIFKQKLLED